ncbi:MAG: PEP-CTERM sorting domain-containing protein [Sphingomonadales bacterium]|nr:PEP-CTERM sorting domain-containing protein [Sphingomonadales bacterium]
MIRQLVTLAVAAGALTLAPAANATQTLQVISGPADTRAVTVSAAGAIGQSFKAFTDTLTSVGFQFNTLNPGAANSPLTLAIYGGETLTGSALFSTSFTLPSSITSRDTVAWVDIAVPSLSLTNGNLYSLVLSAASTRPAVLLGPDFNVNTGLFSGGDAYADGKLLTNWSSIYSNCTGAANNCDLNFRVSGETLAAAVPEPSTWLTLVLGMGAIGAAMRRPRRAGAALQTA